MKLSHFAQALTLALVAVTAYLAWQAQQESSKALAKVDQFAQQQRAVAAAQAEASASLVPGLATPLAMPAPAPAASQLPPLPAAPAPVTAVPAAVAPVPPAPISVAPAPAPAPAPAKAASPGTMPPLPGPLPEPGEKPSAPGSKPAGSPVAVTDTPQAALPLFTPLQRRIKESPALGLVKEALADQGFVALDVGTKNGLKVGQKLDLRRDIAIVGRVTVTAVEESEAIADLDPKSVPAGVKVQVGDELISIVLDR